MTFIAIWLIAVGDGLLVAGALMAISKPSGYGFNFGAAGGLVFGMGTTVAGLLVGMGTGVAWLRARRGGGYPPVRRLPWEKRLRRSIAAAVCLGVIGAVVLGVVPLYVHGEPGSGFDADIPVFLVGLGICGAALLAGAPPALYWLSRQRTRRHFQRGA
ncbi:hypothetical protein ACWEHA_31525 [Amycolatopsis nivea]